MNLFTNSFIETLRNYERNKIVLHFDGKEVTAGKLHDESTHLAVMLTAKGVKKGDRVVIAVKPGYDFLKIIFANMMIRTVVAIIDPEMGRENYKAKLKQLQPQHAFIDSRLVLMNEHPVLKFLVLKFQKSVPSFPRIQNCTIFTVGSRLPILQKHIYINQKFKTPSAEFVFVNSDPNDDFLITYTSGTLEEPKGVVHSYQSLATSLNLLSDMLKQNSDNAIATHLPHFMLLGNVSGLEVFLWRTEWSPGKKIDFIERHQITTLFGPPCEFVPLIDYLQKAHKILPACIKNIYLGSAPVYSSFLNRLIEVAGRATITCLYGMTEILLVCHQDGREKASYRCNGDLVGNPFPGIQLSIAEDGEIGIESNQKFNRYWRISTPKNLHLSGDLGEVDDDGKLVLKGRKKDMIIRGNFNIYPGLYEPTINKIDGIRESAMIGIYDHIRSDEIIILVVEAEKKLEEKEIVRLLESGPYSIDKEALPDKIIFQILPRSGRQNKVNRNVLKEHLQQTLST